MAEAKQNTAQKIEKTGGVKQAAAATKRKASQGKKTKTKKVKLVKIDEKVQTVATTQVVKKQELVVTDRMKRLSEKAADRAIRTDEKKAEPEFVASMKLTDIDSMIYTQEEYEGLLEMYDSTIKDIKEGQIVAGKVLGVSRDDVIVDVGFKSEGLIAISEFPEPINIAVGDEIEVYLEQIEDQNGQLILSKSKADFMKVWDNIKDVHDSGELIEGKLARRIKGGMIVDINGVDAFLPGSQISLRQVPDFDALISTKMQFKIIKLNRNRRNIVVSRRVVLEDEREEKRSFLLKEIAVGQVRDGIVKNITDFGVFIDLAGVDGLLHITDISWGRIKHPSEVVTLGETIKIKILDFDVKTSRISLGLKQLTPYPWESIEEKYPIGKKVPGKVVSITDYGAFIELEKGVEGLIHISEMSWTQHIKHPSKIMNVNDTIDAVVLSVDRENEKISLGIKQMEPDPWEIIEDKYPLNKVVNGKVRNLTAFGSFVELEEGIDGLVHISDMSWTKRVQHPSELMKKGDNIEVKILRIDHENRRISLGLKQLQDDPWPNIAKKYSPGSECLGTISRVLDRGVMVELDDEVEGFVPTTQMGKPDLDSPGQAFSEGEQIPLQVIELDRQAHKVVLSVQAYYKKREQTELDEFIASHPTRTTSLGDSIAKEKPKPVAPESVQPVSETSETASEETAEIPIPDAEASEPAEITPAAEAPTEETPKEETDVEEEKPKDTPETE